MTLTLLDLAAISPLLIIVVTALMLLLLESFAETFAKKISAYLTLASLSLALAAAVFSPASESQLLTPWIQFDSLARLFTIFFLLIGIGSVLLASSFFQNFISHNPAHSEYFFLLLVALFGLMLIGSSADFLTLFLGIETLSISLYILCAYMKEWEFSREAAIKYFLMGAVASGFLLYGIALIYGAIGTTRFDAMLIGYREFSTAPVRILFLSGIAFVTFGLAFEGAIFPFHSWAPDVYAGAPTPVTAFMAIGTKVGAFAAFARLFLVTLPNFNPIWNQGIALLAYPTLIYANIVALRQVHLRRFFAYSGISHAGFLLIPLAAGGAEALPSLLFYLVIYASATFGAFSVLAFLDHRSEGIALRNLQGLFHRSPLLTAVLTLCLLTLSGLPPTAGFFAKFYLLKVAYQAGYYGLVIVGLLTTVLSVFYYLRIIAILFTTPSVKVPPPAQCRSAAIVGTVSCTTIILLSIYPAPLMNLLVQ